MSKYNTKIEIKAKLKYNTSSFLLLFFRNNFLRVTPYFADLFPLHHILINFDVNLLLTFIENGVGEDQHKNFLLT